MKKTVEIRIECEANHKSDNEFVGITPLHPRDQLKRKVKKLKF